MKTKTMHYITTICAGLNLMAYIWVNVAAADVKMSVYAGNTTVLKCENTSPGDEVMMVTWRVHLLNGTQCTLALAEKHSNYNSCDKRMEILPHNNMALRIQNSKITDEGNYTCEVVKPFSTDFSKTVILEILVHPCVILKINKNGVAECKALGGNPIANITWNPESEGLITTDKIKEKDGTSTIISTYRPKNVKVTEVTCVVSHPTFAYPQNRSIELTTAVPPSSNETNNQFTKTNINTDDNILWIVLLIISIIIIIAVIITGSILYWQRRNLRSYYRTGVKGTRAIHTEDNIEQNKEEVEPYASYTQKVNTIYSTAPLNSEAAL